MAELNLHAKLWVGTVIYRSNVTKLDFLLGAQKNEDNTRVETRFFENGGDYWGDGGPRWGGRRSSVRRP